MLLKLRRILISILVFAIFSGNVSFAATVGEQNALRSAKQYLEIMSFSYVGLIEQLEYDGYTKAEAKYAADICFEKNISSAEATKEEEVFSFRNGIHFGDTKEEVEQKEVLEISTKGDNSFKTVESEISTLPGSDVLYAFDDEGCLNSISINFRSENKDKKQMIKDYELIKEGLIRKYGDCLSSDNGDKDFLKREELTAYTVYSLMELTLAFAGRGENHYNQWHLELTDGEVIIEQFASYFLSTADSTLTDDDISIIHEVCYQFYSNEWMDEQIAEQQATQNSIDSDL